MPIHAHGSGWFLETPRSTYAFGVTPLGYLQHWHWGARIRPTDLAQWRPEMYRAFSPNLAGDPSLDRSLDNLPGEYPFPGTGDFRPPAIEVEHADGTQLLRLQFAAARLLPGKPALPGLPAVYVEADAEAETLEVDLRDELGGVLVTLRYTVFAHHDAIARQVRITNRGPTPCRVRRALSASVDLGERRGWRVLHLSGAWARERGVVEASLRPGGQWIESRRGTSSHEHNPFLALLDPDATEERGEVFGFSLVYSGNFLAGIDLDSMAQARAQIGINPAGFAWLLEPGETFHAPEAVLAFSADGLGGLSRTYHRLYRTRLCRGRHRDAPRPVLINNWEATYFDFDQARLVDLARRARRLGVDLFVLDDGWFGRRDFVDSSLGDWRPHPRKLPDGLPALARAIHAEGLDFGLWVEPEMVSPDSDLFRAHPDWCLHVPGRGRSQSRMQLVLDFSRDEVRAAIHDQLAALLRSAPIRYIKWDMNRHLTEVASAGREPARQLETSHRCVLGLYALLEQLTTEFPDVLFESCSGGGGRFDPGLLHYLPQTWTSDNTDAVSRLFIQHGTSIVYPLSAMAAHVSIVPNHQVGRTTPLTTRGLVAMTGAFGLELDLAKCTEGELTEMAGLITRHKRWQPLLATGDLYRLASPFAGNVAAWMVVSADATEALVFHCGILAEPNGPLRRLRLQGLRPELNYRDVETGASYPGDALLAHGWLLKERDDFSAQVWHLQAQSPG